MTISYLALSTGRLGLWQVLRLVRQFRLPWLLVGVTTGLLEILWLALPGHLVGMLLRLGIVAPEPDWAVTTAVVWQLGFAIPFGVGLVAWVARRYAERSRRATSPRGVVVPRSMDGKAERYDVLWMNRDPGVVLHRIGDRACPTEERGVLVDRGTGARPIELSGDSSFWSSYSDEDAEQIGELPTGDRSIARSDRVLATVLFTDLVSSTTRAAQLGDRRWHELLEVQRAKVRLELVRFRGREIETAGDGFLVTFDAPSRAVRAACAIAAAVKPLGLEIRAGVHTGEIELSEDRIDGIAVHIAARVMALARPGEVLVSSTVKELTTGSGIRLRGRGSRHLRGIPDRWSVFGVVPEW